MASSPILYVYYPPSNDDAYPGVPGRHITEADWASFTIAQRRTIENATTQEGYTRRKVWVHRDLVDETEEERAQREAAEAAARAEYDRKNSLVRYGQIETMIDQLEVLPPAEEFALLRSDVDAVADVPPRVDAVETKVTALPTIIAGNYTKRLANYGNNLAAAIADLPDAGAKGGDILLDGEMAVTATTPITAPVNLLGRGRGATAFVAPAGVTFPVLDIDGRSGVTLADFSVIKADGAKASGNGHGVRVRGNADHILVERVLADGFVAPFYVGGQLGTVSGTAGHITFRDCIAANSPDNFGFWIDDCEYLTVDNCEAYGNWLDGLKLRKKTKRTFITGGSFHHNGVSGTGDGADMYAGGEEFVVNGSVFSHNGGSGLTIKQGIGTDVAEFGYVNNIDLIGVQCTDNTAGAGLYMSEAQDDPGRTQPLTSNISVIGGLFARNRGASSDGIYLGTRNTIITGARVMHNDRNGIMVNDRSLEVTIGEVIVAGNSRAGAGFYDGIATAGSRVRIVSGTILGIENPDISDEAEYATQTKWHRYNINMFGGDDVYVGMGVREGYAAQVHGIFVQPTAATRRFIVEQPMTGSPISFGAYGSIGSRRIQTDAAGRQVAWEKVSGATNAPLSGWSPVLHGSGPKALSLNFGSIAPGASETLSIGFSVADGVAATDMAIATPPSTLDPALVIHAWCTANTVNIRLYNPTTAAIDPVAGTWSVATLKV